jgi:hypothetical protein
MHEGRLASMADQLDAYEPEDDAYPWWDAYDSGDRIMYAHAMSSVQCPVHHAAVCRCVDPALNSHLPSPEYIRISISMVTDDDEPFPPGYVEDDN